MKILKTIASLRKLPLILWGGFLLLCSVVSCMDDEEYSVSPDDRLVFSVDTVKLDTVISGQLTNTYTFQVYNPGKKSLRIPRVFLESGAASPYRVNVDGTILEGGEAQDFEISDGDSLRVFLALNAPDRDEDEPVEENDRLTFVTEAGVAQSVVFTASGQSVIPLRGKVITADTLLDARRPYQILDSLYVAEGATLKLAAGVKLYFHPEVNLLVDGRLLAEGTLEAPVMLRGDRLGNMFSNQPYDRVPGQWGGVILREPSYGNVLNFCDIHSGRFGLQCDSSDVEKEKLRLENSIVHNMSGDVLSVRAAQVYVGNSQLTNAGGNCVTLRGGHSTFVHCTIANFYAFAGGRGVALDFSNAEGDIRLPLYQAAFYNTIITGYSEDEIMGSRSERYEEDEFNYLFNTCLLNTPEVEDEKFVNCLWDGAEKDSVSREDNFFPEFDLKQLVFSFGLSEKSKALHAADAEVTQQYYPVDRLGRSRFLDEGPDLGCYEADLSLFEKEEDGGQ